MAGTILTNAKFVEESMSSDPEFIYIYYETKEGHIVYDRTVSNSVLGRSRANHRIEELLKTYPDAIWSTKTIPGAFY